MYTVGQTLQGFTITKAIPIEEIDCTFVELEHDITRARVVYIKADDPENVFSIALQTIPDDSTGVAHILEHIVLCGSTKFPVKDPFFSMLRRSMNTYMNALTGADFTCYPAASQNEKDFYNLLSVYADAVFHPKLTKESFLQEGHRFEFQQKDNPSSPLTYQGVVFNEMKGAMSSPDAQLWQAVSSTIMPDVTYAHNSGGDPANIPDLTHKQLKAFHQTYYTPSRAVFFFYGNLPIEKHLSFLNEHVLEGASALTPLPPFPKQPRFTSPKKVTKPYSTNQVEKGAMITFSFLTTSIENQKDILALHVLDSVLMENDAAPLRRALLETGAAAQVDGFFDTEMSEAPYVIVCKGCDANDVDTLETALRQGMQNIVEKGIDKKLIDAAIHQLELQRTEITGDHGPYGLGLFFRTVLAKFHGAPPENSLQIHKLFEELLRDAQDPTYFTSLLQTYFLDNPHRVTLTLVPDPDLKSRQEQEERTKLDALQKTLSKEEAEEIVSAAVALEAHQEKEESLDCLPNLDRSDIPKEPVTYSISSHTLGKNTTYFHKTNTNGILYVDTMFDLSEMASEDIPYLALLTTIMAELGCNGDSFEQTLSRESLYTGGIATGISLFEQATAPSTAKPAFTLHGKALERNIPELFSLKHDLLTSLRFDELDRLKELVAQIRNGLEQRLTRKALGYATLLAHAPASSLTTFRNLTSGLPYLEFIRSLPPIEEVAPKLASLYELIRSGGHVETVVSGNESLFEKAAPHIERVLQPQGTHPMWKISLSPMSVSSCCKIIASPVAFTASACTTIPGTHKDAAALTLASSLFENTVLHKRIREQGGAYGSGANYNLLSGQYHFYSYRDPNLKTTLDAFSEAIETIGNGNFTDQDINDAIFSSIQAFDNPISPGSRGMHAYSLQRTGRTQEMRIAYRNALLQASKEDIQSAVQAHLNPAFEHAITVSFCGEQLAEKEALFPTQKV